MKIPIFNSLYIHLKKKNLKKIRFNKMNNLELKKVDTKKFPVSKIIKKIIQKIIHLFETVLITIK